MHHLRAAFFVCFLAATTLWGQERLLITDFGVQPNGKENAAVAVQAAVAIARQKESATIVFPKGRYDFYVDKEKGVNDGFHLPSVKNLTIDGQGSEFVFHGFMGIASLGRSENITFTDFTVDWDKPVIVQGEVVAVIDDTLDIHFDPKDYAFEIEEEKLVFPGEGWRGTTPGRYNLFDPKTKEMLYRTRDYAMGYNYFANKAENIGNDTVRIHAKPDYRPPVGTVITIWFDASLRRYGFNIQSSKDITIRNVVIYHAFGLGVIAQRTENLTLDAVDCRANDAKGRFFSVGADSFHLNNMKGLVKVENCEHTGMGDDFLNLHGKNMMIHRRIDDRTLEVSREPREAPMYSFAVGDEIWFLDGKTAQRIGEGVIERIEPVRENDKIVTHRLRFAAPVPPSFGDQDARDAIENKTFNAELEVRNCRILKRHRARGILATTPLRTVIENNYFRNSGAAVLIEGDTNFWFESGACGDVLIRDNVFEDCFTSGPEWGEAVITVTPSFRPQSETDEPFHRNIRIENNTFRHFDPAILFARSVRDLVFRNNTIFRTKSYEPFMDRPTFLFDGCRNVLLEGNSYGKDVLGKNYAIEHMKPSDIRVNDKEIVPVPPPTGKRR